MMKEHTNFQALLILSFRLHDWITELLTRYIGLVKKILLLVAHLGLLGFFFPHLRSEFGEWAATLLIGILFLSPLSRILRMRLLLVLMGLRREMGIIMAYLATVHGLGYFFDPAWYPIFFRPYFPNDIFGIEPALLFGMGAYFFTLPLLFTSNALANQFLGGKNWKRLHRLVYIVFILAIFHRMLMRGANPIAQFQAALLLGSYVFLKLLAWKNFLPPLVFLIEAVARQYHIFRSSLTQSVSSASSSS